MSEQLPVNQNAPQKKAILDLINNTAVNQIPNLPEVEEKFIANYNLSNESKNGAVVWHSRKVAILQAINEQSALSNCDKFSVYACIVQMAVNDYDPAKEADEIYLIPRGGKMCIDRQAGVYVKRLIQSKQITGVQQVAFVRNGDRFVWNNGVNHIHEERMQSPEIIAAYVFFDLPSGKQKGVRFTQDDWSAWRESSPLKNGTLWNYKGQPNLGFLATKIIKHACQLKIWSTHKKVLLTEYFPNVEIDSEDLPMETTTGNSDETNEEILPANIASDETQNLSEEDF